MAHISTNKDEPMKTNQVICDANGQRKVTSTTETLRIKASEIEPGDWLLKPHGRVMRKDKLVIGTERQISPADKTVLLTVQSLPSVRLHINKMVDVERTR